MATVTLRRPHETVLPGSDGPHLQRFSVDQYHQMIAVGILTPASRCELIHGWITEKMPTNPPHTQAVRVLNRLLVRMLSDDWVLSPQQPVTTADSEPEPDIAVATGPESKYADRHPTPRESVLVIEVSDTSLAYDRGTKLELYAENRIAEYWIVNLIGGVVEVYTQPRGGKRPTYRARTDYAAGQVVPVVLGGKQVGAIAVSDILPGGN